MSSNGRAKEVIHDAPREQATRRGNKWSIWNRLRVIMVLPSLLWWTWSPWFTQHAPKPMGVAVVGDGDFPDIGFPKDVLRNWAQYSPYIPAAQYVPPPPGCAVTQVRSHVPLFPDFQLITTNALGEPGMGYFTFYLREILLLIHEG